LVAERGGGVAAADSLCASVKIEIEQELTLERQEYLGGNGKKTECPGNFA